MRLKAKRCNQFREDWGICDLSESLPDKDMKMKIVIELNTSASSDIIILVSHKIT